MAAYFAAFIVAESITEVATVHLQFGWLFVIMRRMNVDQIDWPKWKPTEYANLCFVIRAGQILLIRKKRGLGAGKINGPGGRLEPGETAEQAAIRETQEEIGVTPTGLEHVGELFFHFLDGYKLHVAVFAANGCEGKLIETDEATPIWTDIPRIPYDEMWQDDPFWLPLVVKLTKFRGFFVFDRERLLSHRVDLL
jgi:8-oxo-dGTP diphosphatase